MDKEAAYCITETVREPLVIFDEHLHVVAASRSFYLQFHLSPEETVDHLIFELDNGRWDIPDLRKLLETVKHERDSIENFEVRHRFEKIGGKVFLCNARRICPAGTMPCMILLAIKFPHEQTDEELRRRTAQLEATIDSIPDGYIVYGPDRSILRMNAVAEEILGFTGEVRDRTYEERIGRLDVQSSSGEELPLESIPSNRAFRGETIRNEIMKISRPDRYYWLSVSAAPIIADDGSMHGVVMEFADITERKELEKQLENERDFVAAVIQTSGALITVIDREGKITRFNKACEDLTGYSADEVLGGNLFDLFIPPEEREDVAEVAARLLAGESRVDFENHWLTRHGEKRFIRWQNSNMPDNKGTPVYIVATGIDITDRKKAEEAMRKSEEQFRNERNILQQIVNNLPYSFILLNPDFRIEYANKTVLDRFGLTLEEVQGKTGHEIFSKEIMEIYLPLLQKVRDTGIPFSGEISYHVGGNLVTNIPDIVPLFNERKEIHHIIILSIDITERKHMEVALRESEASLKRSQEIAHLGSWELDLAGNHLTWSDEIYRIFGLQPQEFGATYEAFLDHVHPDDRSKVDEAYRISLQNGRDSYEIEHRVVRKNSGEIRYVHEKCQHLRDSDGMVIRSVGMVHDITDRKHAEEALQRRTEELAAANKELEAFSYSVSHDLRAPLTTIQGFINLLLEEHVKNLDEQGRSFINHIKNATDKMISIIEDLLKVARISRETMNRQEIDLTPAAWAIINELRKTEPQRNVLISIPGRIPAYADPGLITIALTNLLGNAWKYTGKNPDARIDFGIMSMKNEDVYFVRDNGAGFDMKFAHKLFQPFERLHSGSEFAGTGIGLTIVQKIIHRHGGRIWAESETDKGTAFYFTLG